MVGLFWALFTGDMETSLYIAIFFELFWLDLIPVGTYIPPHLTAATFAALSLTTYFGFENPAKIMGILFASMPLAWIGAKLEAILREQERGSYNKLLNWARSPETNVNMPSQLVMKALGRKLIFSFVTFYISLLVLKFTLDMVFSLYPGFLSSISVSWAHLWIAATMGGLMALRLKRVYGVLALGTTLVALYLLSGQFQ